MHRLAASLGFLVAACAAQSGGGAAPPTAAGCNDAASDAIAFVSVTGNVFQALPSADGCWVFASFPGGAGSAGGGRRGANAEASHVALLRRSGGRMSVERTLPISGGATGMALTHDGQLLIVAAGARLAFVDVANWTRGRGDAVAGYLDEPGVRGRIYANVTADDRFLFVADENVQTITVIALARARATGFGTTSVIGKIPTGGAPIALTFSPDEKYLFATSEVAPRGFGWPVACKREAGNDPTPVNPEGAIHVIDVARATRDPAYDPAYDPAHAILRSVPAGCSAVRLVLSPTGDRAYVTARNSNALLVFDTAKLLSDTAHALIARVPVGTAPVGVAVIDDGRKVIVTNSNRFGGSASDHQMLTVIDAARVGEGSAAVLGNIPAGGFPREMRVTSDGRTLLVTNFTSRTIEVIDLARLAPMK